MGISRRTVLSAAALLLAPKRSRAAAKTLRICQWTHFVKGYDKWFNGTYIKEWGEKNDTEVIVDNIGIPAINTTAAAEVAARKGHDLFLFLAPKPVYEEDVIDHAEIYQECEKRYGKPIELAVKSTWNPKTKKYFGFSDAFVPDPINFRTDLWGEVGMKPDSWDEIRAGGKKIKEKTGIPVGIGLSAEIDTSMAMRAIMYSHGAHEQDEAGNLTLNSPKTLEALKFVKALYQDTMTDEVLAWEPASNNRAMLAGKSSLVLNAISITREAENNKMPIGDKIGLAKAARGPVMRMGLEHVMYCWGIWKFAANIEGAKKFLIDYVGNFHRVFEASEAYNFPCFPKQVPDLEKLLPGKYAVLADAQKWATNVGYPGHANAGIDDLYSNWVLNTMFAKTATGTLSPEDALKEADAAAHRIWAKWKERKLL